MKVKIDLIKKIAITMFAVPALAVTVINSQASGQAAGDNKEAADTYAAKCKMCHGASSEKLFDATKPDADLAEVILKGKKGDKPPNMPAYEPKGMTQPQAAALVTYMKSLKH